MLRSVTSQNKGLKNNNKKIKYEIPRVYTKQVSLAASASPRHIGPEISVTFCAVSFPVA
jgi:preprotein translocase subunit SecB